MGLVVKDGCKGHKASRDVLAWGGVIFVASTNLCARGS